MNNNRPNNQRNQNSGNRNNNRRDTRGNDSGERDYDNYDDRRYAKPKKNLNTILLVVLIALCAVGLAIAGFALFGRNGEIKLEKSMAMITAVVPAYESSQQAYKNCQKQATTTYVKNQKSGTTGQIVGGTTGAVAGGVIGKQIGGNTAGTLIGGAVGALGGAVVGDKIQKSQQPDYVAKKGSKTVCKTEYKTVQTQKGYTISYIYKEQPGQINSPNQLTVGTKLSMEELQALATPPASATTTH